jgi:hypothetical protein
MMEVYRQAGPAESLAADPSSEPDQVSDICRRAAQINASS